MVIQNKSKKIKFIASISLLVFTIAAYNVCRIPTATNAESYGTPFSVEDSTYLNVSIPESVILNVTPTAAGQFAKTSMEISVDTNNTTGYTLTMTADTTSLSRTSAVNGIDYSIPTLEQAYTCTDESATTCDNFPVGYWGYKFTNAETTDSNTYSPMTTTASPIRFLKEFKNTTDTTTVTFGTKLSNSIPNGTYDGVNLTFIATTNYVIPETAKYMQDFNAVIADSLTPGITYTTKDSRDNQDYTVAKLADGNVWMTKNLNLNITDTNVKTKLSQSTTNASGESLDYLLNGGGTNQFARVGVTEASNMSSYEKPYINLAKTNDANEKGWSYGIYYNYCAASAGSYCYDGISGEGNMTEDICPAGWRIPTGGSEGEYKALFDTFTDNSAFVDNLKIPLSGEVTDSLKGFGSYATLWSSTRFSVSAMYSLLSGYTSSNAANMNYRNAGRSIRCIKDRSMQNFSATDAAAMSEGQTITLVDNRDNKEYKVTKINGRVWMTQNLAFTGTTLTPADSNVSENTTMTYYSLDSSDDSYADHCNGANGYSYACIKDSGSTETGVWYNYAAASAGTITGSSNTTPATSSLCPSGWHLPTGPAADTSSEFYKIFQNTTSGSWVAANDYTNAFKAVTGSRYSDGSLGNAGVGLWWSATAGNATRRYDLYYNGSQFNSDNSYRYLGFFVRCVQD